MPKLAFFIFIYCYKHKIFMFTGQLCAQKQCYKTSEKNFNHAISKLHGIGNLAIILKSLYFPHELSEIDNFLSTH